MSPAGRRLALGSHGPGAGAVVDGSAALVVVVGDSSGPTDFFLYDPKDPAPSLGMGATGAVVDQTPVEKRKDVLDAMEQLDYHLYLHEV